MSFSPTEIPMSKIACVTATTSVSWAADG
jgi:hypothetical protein